MCAVTFTTVALCLQLVGASSFLFNMIWIWVRLCSWFDTPGELLHAGGIFTSPLLKCCIYPPPLIPLPLQSA